MSEQEIIEGNRLIAEFIGMTIKEGNWRESFTGWYRTNGFLNVEYIQEESLLFHSSLDWLIPVFERIQYIDDNNSEFFDEYYNIEFTIDLLNGVTFKIDKKRIFMQTAFGPGQLVDSVWSGVISFIKWYNEHTNN